MPSPFVPTPEFPTVAPLPGVPPLLRAIGQVFAIPALALADGPLPMAQGGRWGIFGQGGSPLLTVNSVAAIEYSRDYQVSDYPQEKGAFASYNKVKTPFAAKVAFLISDTRTDFLNAIEAAVASLDLVSVVTPEIEYPSANLTHYSYRREARSGVTLIRVEVWCVEIRVISGASSASTSASASSAGVTSPQSDNAAPVTQDGAVQPVEANTLVSGLPAPTAPAANLPTPDLSPKFITPGPSNTFPPNEFIEPPPA